MNCELSMVNCEFKNHPMPMTAVVLAGGQSQRMRADKAFVSFGGKTLIERVMTVLTPLFEEIVINSNSPEAYTSLGLPVIPDIFPGKGALGGIYSGLVQAKTRHIFCAACDMPFLEQRFIRYMQQQAYDYDVLVPHTPDGFHPLLAIYSKRCQGVIEELLHNHKLKISLLFPRVRTRYITAHEIQQFDPYYDSFLNVNTPEDLERARKREKERKREHLT